MQFKDTGATDQYNNQWVSYAPYPPGDDFTGEEITSSPSRAGGGVFYFDCIGRLTTQGSFGVPEYFAAIASGDIATVYLLYVKPAFHDRENTNSSISATRRNI